MTPAEQLQGCEVQQCELQMGSTAAVNACAAASEKLNRHKKTKQTIDSLEAMLLINFFGVNVLNSMGLVFIMYLIEVTVYGDIILYNKYK